MKTNLYQVINIDTKEVVYSSFDKKHTEIYINTCNYPFKYSLKTSYVD